MLLSPTVSAVFRTYLHLQDVGKLSIWLREVGERTGWLRNRLLQALPRPEPGGRRSSEGHAWSVVGVRLGPVLGGACPGFRPPPQPSVELN